jgi:hypothetical protein
MRRKKERRVDWILPRLGAKENENENGTGQDFSGSGRYCSLFLVWRDGFPPVKQYSPRWKLHVQLDLLLDGESLVEEAKRGMPLGDLGEVLLGISDHDS